MGAVTPLLLPLTDPRAEDPALCGGKAARLAVIGRLGFPTPGGFAVTVAGYRRFLAGSGIGASLAFELGRKPLAEMRWEEMWDAALRIRSLFAKAAWPEDLRGAVLGAVHAHAATSFAVRSSAPHEDGVARSCAGLHESYLNVQGERDLLGRIADAFASLWSSAALAFSAELALHPSRSAMAVLVQPLVSGKVSGVAFGEAPDRPETILVESVPGLNQGLVDGRVAPDRHRLTPDGGILSHETAVRESILRPAAGGGVMEVAEARDSRAPLLEPTVLRDLCLALRRLREEFDGPQDVEWTLVGGSIVLLQSRPITRCVPETGTRRAFDLSLRRSFPALRALRDLIRREHLPGLARDAERLRAAVDAGVPPDDRAFTRLVADGLSRLAHWETMYWRDFIPFVHGARLFGEVYLERMKPSDPHEFVKLLSVGSMLSLARNAELVELARRRAHLAHAKDPAAAERLARDIAEWRRRTLPGDDAQDGAEHDEAFARLLDELASAPPAGRGESSAGEERALLETRFLAAFPPEEQGEARELLDLARFSYRLRDDDNLHLGGVRAPAERLVALARHRLGLPADEPADATLAALRRRAGEEDAAASRAAASPLPGSGFVPPVAGTKHRSLPAPHEAGHAPPPPFGPGVRVRQMRGQPAGPGLSRGPARVVRDLASLFSLRRGEVLVTDSISPEMAMVVPLASAIVERRGGMLVHGAIIAREYGLPCVTGVTGLLEAVATGDTLTVDGHFGLVTVERDEDARQAGALPRATRVRPS